jgi:hypothetical protein
MATIKELKERLSELPSANQVVWATAGQRKHLSSLRACLRNIRQDQAEIGYSSSRPDTDKELRFVNRLIEARNSDDQKRGNHEIKKTDK